MFRYLVFGALLVLAGACAGDNTHTTDLPGSTSPPTPVISMPSSVTPPTVRPTTVPSTTSGAAATSTTEASPSPEEITILDGVVTGPDSIEVQLGAEAVFIVTADVADEVHVHGYDLTFDLEPGVQVEVRVLADIPGIFEVELEAAHLPLVELTVVP